MILLFCIIMLGMLCACGGGDSGEAEASVSSEPVRVSASEETTETEEGTFRYENMYFSLELPAEWEDQVELLEERGGEYYLVTASDRNEEQMLFQIELSAREQEMSEEKSYLGELYVPGDQGHLNIVVTRPSASVLSGASEDFQQRAGETDRILDGMEPCGDFAIRKN